MSYEKGIVSNVISNPKKFGAMQSGRLVVSKAFHISKFMFLLMKVLLAVFKSSIKDHLISYLLDNDLICVQQFDFVQGRSTSLQLLDVLSDLTEAWESNIEVDVIYLDFIKAFDIVPHMRLLYKISRYRIKDPLHGWIRSFLAIPHNVL